MTALVCLSAPLLGLGGLLLLQRLEQRMAPPLPSPGGDRPELG